MSNEDAGDAEIDISEEQQDWRFLHSATKSNGSLPKRGEKDFEPNGTNIQSKALEESREAMYTALQGERGHYGKNHVTAVWYADVNKAQVDVAKGPLFNTIGKSDSNGKLWLLPEETIYMVERGSLECFYPQGAPMSLQAVYAACIQNKGDLERLQVYTYLKKLGFIIQRAKSYDNDYPTVEHSPYKVVPQTPTLYGYVSLLLLNLQKSFYATVFDILEHTDNNKYCKNILGAHRLHLSPVSKLPQIIIDRPVYHDYASVYNDLDIIPHHKPPHSNTISAPFDVLDEPEYPYRVAFNVWKPNASAFKKSNPPAPDFRVAVVSTRDTRVPTLRQTLALLNSVPVTESGFMVHNSRKKRALEAKARAEREGRAQERQPRNQTWALKDGWRNVILAVSDAGVISFTKVTDPGFGEEKVYFEGGNNNGKTKGGIRNNGGNNNRKK